MLSVSDTNPVTDGNEPVEVPITGPEDWATSSFPFPTVEGSTRSDGGAVLHSACCHTVLGYATVKHPACGVGIWDIWLCHVDQFGTCGGAVAAVSLNATNGNTRSRASTQAMSRVCMILTPNAGR